MKQLPWLDSHSAQCIEQLLAFEGRYRTDSLVVAFEQAIGQKAVRVGDAGLSVEEKYFLAVEALEAVGCRAAKAITRDAIAALDLPDGSDGAAAESAAHALPADAGGDTECVYGSLLRRGGRSRSRRARLHSQERQLGAAPRMRGYAESLSALAW